MLFSFHSLIDRWGICCSLNVTRSEVKNQMCLEVKFQNDTSASNKYSVVVSPKPPLDAFSRLTHIHLSHTNTYCTLTLSSLLPSSISPAGRLLCLTGGVCPCKHPANSACQSKCFRKMIGCHESRGLVLSVRLR